MRRSVNRPVLEDREIAERARMAFFESPFPSMRARHVAERIDVPDEDVERVLERLRDESGLLRRHRGKWTVTSDGRRAGSWRFEPVPPPPPPTPWRKFQDSLCLETREAPTHYQRTGPGRGAYRWGTQYRGAHDAACAGLLGDLVRRQAGTTAIAKLALEAEDPDSWVHGSPMTELRELVAEYIAKPSRADLRRAIEKLRQQDRRYPVEEIEYDMRLDLRDGPQLDDPGRSKRKSTPDPQNLLAQFSQRGVLGSEEHGVRPAQRQKPKDPRRRQAEDAALAIHERMAALFGGPRGADSIAFALDELGLRPVADEAWGGEGTTWDELEAHYDTTLYRADELPDLIHADVSVDEAGEVIDDFLDSARFVGESGWPDWLVIQKIADRIYPDPAFGKLRLVNIPKEAACEFVRIHHSALPQCNPKGMMYAIGAALREKGEPQRLVAVATAGSPSGAFDRADCDKYGTLELQRIASSGEYKGASSMLAARMMDLLPASGRVGADGRRRIGCRFVTYSMVGERGTTYLALVSKGLRPVAYNKGARRTGARARAGASTGKSDVDKIVWMSGPAADPPKWSVLQDVIEPRQLETAIRTFAKWDAKDVAQRIKQMGRAGVPLLRTRTRPSEEDGRYLPLAKRGLRPVALDQKPKSGTQLVWEAGPGAGAPRWDLVRNVPAAQLDAARHDLEDWRERSQAQAEKAAAREALERRLSQERSGRPAPPPKLLPGESPVQARLFNRFDAELERRRLSRRQN